MRERYEPLPVASSVFRTVRIGGGFLPEGHRLPKLEWLVPTADDCREAEQTGRPAGLSVWDMAFARHADACWYREVDPAEHRSFWVLVDVVGQVAARNRREVAVVADPLSLPEDDRAAGLDPEQRARLERAGGGHSLIEGLRRPEATRKQDQRRLLDELAHEFSPLLDQE